MRNGCYPSLNPNNAGTVWNRTKARWAIDGTLATVPAAFGASDLAAGSGSGGGSDESLLSQSLRSGGDPQNAGAGRAQLRKLIVGQWLMVLTLSAVTGGTIGLLFENVLMVLLKPVLPAALPPASLWPWLWALGTMTVISLLVG